MPVEQQETGRYPEPTETVFGGYGLTTPVFITLAAQTTEMTEAERGEEVSLLALPHRAGSRIIHLVQIDPVVQSVSFRIEKPVIVTPTNKEIQVTRKIVPPIPRVGEWLRLYFTKAERFVADDPELIVRRYGGIGLSSFTPVHPKGTLDRETLYEAIKPASLKEGVSLFPDHETFLSYLNSFPPPQRMPSYY